MLSPHRWSISLTIIYHNQHKMSILRYSMQENQNNTQNTSQPTNSLYKDAEIEQKVKQDIDNYIEDY